MFRHGIRTWLQTYPGEPLPVSIWDSQGGLSVLTNVGIKQMTEFGDFFGSYFKDSIEFNAAKTFVRTTDRNRTITSAQYFLKGLFGKNSITINNTPRKVDYVRFF